MTRALVLGGGGPVGIAWEIGLAAGLEQEGVRLADADFIVGTSAGSVVGATLAFGPQRSWSPRSMPSSATQRRAAQQTAPSTWRRSCSSS